MVRLLVGESDLREASYLLSDISEGLDSGNRIMINVEALDTADEILAEAGIDYDVI